MIKLRLNCIPQPWSAPQKGKNCFYDKKAEHKQDIRWQLKVQYQEKPLVGHLGVYFTFLLPIPKSASKKMREKMLNREILPTSPDTTNMQKLYEDCLQGIVIENDRYVNKTLSERYYSDKPGVDIFIERAYY